MKIRIHNNDGSDYVDYTGTLEEIKDQAKERIKLPELVNLTLDEYKECYGKNRG